MMRKRFLLLRDDGSQEVPAEMMRRISKALAEVERDYGASDEFVHQTEKDFFEVMAKKEFVPAGRTITNAGAPTALVANCIVLPIMDSMEGIFQTLKDAALLQQAGSGLGFSFSHLRPAGSPTKRSRGVSSGPISFLEVYNQAFGMIKQQGRHGANMAVMRVDHPDILDFMNCKKVEGRIRNFNISVGITDEFMEAVINKPDELWLASFNGEKMKPRKILRAKNGSVTGYEELDITAKQIFDELVEGAWTNGEPGVVFLDTVNKVNPLPRLGEIDACNPCGEQFLHHYDVCNLGSINLAAFTLQPFGLAQGGPAQGKQKGEVDWNRLAFVTKTAIRLLDNVIDRSNFSVPKVTEMMKANRRIGLGVMGFADLLYQLNIKYNSAEGFALAEKLMAFIQKASEEVSEELAEKKGVFPNYNLSVFRDRGVKMRNAALTTVAPTGSISMMLDTSSGIEPNFALLYTKQDKDGHKYHYLNKYFKEALEKRGIDLEKVKEEIVKTGSVQNLEWLPKDFRDTFVVSMDMSAEDHIGIQAAFQRHVDNSISKTINFPNSATREEVIKGYISAWQAGCKGCTVYREGSRTVQILNLGTGDNLIPPSELVEGTENAMEKIVRETPKHSPKPRPEVLSGQTYKVKTGYGNLYVTINNDEHMEPFEIFATIGKSGGFFQEQSEGICRLISLSLRAGVRVDDIIKDLKGIRGPMPVMTNKGTILSLPDAIGQILEEHMKYVRGEVPRLEAKTSETLTEHLNKEVLVASALSSSSLRLSESNDLSKGGDLKNSGQTKKSIADFGMMPGCPECGNMLEMSEGCMSCKGCGFSRCL